MKFKKILFITVLFSLLGWGANSQKTLAHADCESFRNCHRNSVNQEKIDYWTNYFFKLVRPEMRHKRVRAHHTLYRRELTEIRRVVSHVIDRSCQQPHLDHYYVMTDREGRITREPQRSSHSYGYSRVRRRATPRAIRPRDYYNHELALRDRYDDWDRADYYETELPWAEELWTKNYYWQRSDDYFFNGLYQDLANAVFYARHPELQKNIAIKDNFNWATEWTFIRQYFASFEEEDFLKQHFIPLCDYNSNSDNY